MWPLILTIIGLILQILSVLYCGRKYWFFWKSMKEKKQKHYEEIGRSLGERIERTEKDWFISFGLLSIGVILQAIAELLILEW